MLPLYTLKDPKFSGLDSVFIPRTARAKNYKLDGFTHQNFIVSQPRRLAV